VFWFSFVQLSLFFAVEDEEEEESEDEEEQQEDEDEEEAESEEEIEYVEDFDESDVEDMEDLGDNLSDEEEIIKTLPKSKKRALELEYEPSTTKSKERLKNRRQISSNGANA